MNRKVTGLLALLALVGMASFLAVQPDHNILTTTVLLTLGCIYFTCGYHWSKEDPMTNTCVIPAAIEAGWEGMTDLFRNCSDDLIEKYQGLGEFKGVGPDSGWQGLATWCCGFHEQNFPNLVTEAAKFLRAAPYESQAAKDAARAAYGGPRYWAYLDEAAKRHNTMERSLSESLAGNEGD